MDILAFETWLGLSSEKVNVFLYRFIHLCIGEQGAVFFVALTNVSPHASLPKRTGEEFVLEFFFEGRANSRPQKEGSPANTRTWSLRFACKKFVFFEKVTLTRRKYNLA